MEALTKYINRISRCTTQHRSDQLEDEGLNGYQHVYILSVCSHPGISQEQLSQLICINKSNVARQLALMEQNGFILRQPCPEDRRVTQVYPSQKAVEIYPKVRQIAQSWNHYLTEDFSEEEYTQLLSMLRRMTEKAQKGVKRK